MAKQWNTHWFAPALMMGSLLGGFFCALGHHLFYASLAGQTAPTGQYEIAGASISMQQLNTAVGTAFGFLVKSFLTLTIATAFVQAFWRSLRTASKGSTLGTLDSAYSVLSNLLALLNFKAWSAFPLPLSLAFIAWLVPIASIVTPATLSVQSTAVAPAPVHAVDVPKLDFTNQAFAAPIPHGPQQNFADQIVTTATQQRGGFCFNGPSQAVSRVATAVAAEGQILSISAPGSNVSWILDFWAPSLRCADVETTERDGMFNHILDQWGNVSSCSHAFGYMAWPTEINRSVPLVQPHANSSTRVFEQDSMTYDAPASIYVATLPQMFNFAFLPAGNSDLQEKCRFYGRNSLVYSYPISDDVCLPGLQPPACYGQQAWLTDATLTRCDLLNATYRAVFEYRDGAQNITVTLGDSSSASPVIPQRCLNGTALHEDSAKLISYQGISAAFNDLVLGSITLDTGGAIPGPVFNSNVGNTVLMETEDLAFVVNFKGVNNTFDYLNTSRFPARENQRIGRRGSLKSALETLFQNITLSLLADEVLLANYSSPYAPADKSDVTFNLFHNVYIYSAPTLWGAYGVAIFLTLIALTLGFWSLLLNQGSFTNDFSTVLRTSWAGHLDEEVRIGDRDGRQPLPNYLSNARFWLGVDKSGSRLRSGGVELKEQPSAQTALLEVRREPV